MSGIKGTTSSLIPKIMGNTIASAALGGGLLSCIPFTIGVGLSFYFHPSIWIADITRHKRPIPEESKRTAVAWVCVFVTILLSGSTGTAWYVAKHSISSDGGGAGAGPTRLRDLFLAAYGVHAVVNIFDVVVIDWIIYNTIYPPSMRIPGIPKLEGYRPHVEDACGGMTAGVLLALCTSIFVKWYCGIAI